MTTREACPECGLDFEGRRDNCPECGWEMEYRDRAPLEKLRELPWGQLVAGYFTAGFVIFVFAADTGAEPGGGFFGLLLFAWMVAGYFIPSFVAWKRGHHQTMAIAALNVFAGWTIVGWIGSLIWSLTALRD